MIVTNTSSNKKNQDFNLTLGVCNVKHQSFLERKINTL